MNKRSYFEDHWNSTLYDDRHAFVSKFGNHLLELLKPRKTESILDLGAGTGDLANELAKLGVDVTGVDQSSSMVAKARSKYPHLSFDVADATNLPFTETFDAVFSNAVLHWVLDAEAALKSIWRVLKPGGRFVAEFGGKGNVETITTELIAQIKQAGYPYSIKQFPWYFPSIGEYASLMEKTGFSVSLAQLYERPTPLEGEDGFRNWLDMFARPFFNEIDEQDKQGIIAKTEIALQPVLMEEGQWIADYKRLVVIGYKIPIK
ncbi:SAM-dependent methyltransferase [Shouchella clausii]|uniref:class I SAM-dependent methyltransferase n=1 Tax=Shouchella tritolerans TaxID=2979466 RepID=UPI0007884F1A|nr:class I SAM-dependent methyltransferase [Shouchella tritolerans]GIN12395.1 SAM-dependent methyltransferase [Shouchella clausii]